MVELARKIERIGMEKFIKMREGMRR